MTLRIQEHLRETGDVGHLRDALGITVTEHAALPLVLFNYSQTKTPRASPIGLECRGLVLERVGWRVVAKSLRRFFNYGEKDAPDEGFDFDDFVVQAKEDGSMLVLYFYEGAWRLNTRSAFLDPQDAPERTVLMAGLYEVRTKELVDRFAAALGAADLAAAGARLDAACTYTFEFCSRLNRVVRDYPDDKVVLLHATETQTLRELPDAALDAAAAAVGAQRPRAFPELTSVAGIRAFLRGLAATDPSLEGVVIRDRRSRRWKLKAPSYYFLHHLTFDRLQSPGPKHLVPFIVEGEGHELFSVLETNGLDSDLYETRRQWEFCEARLRGAYTQLMEDLDAVAGAAAPAAFAAALRRCRSPVKALLKDIYEATGAPPTPAAVDAAWRRAADLLVAKLFTKEERGAAPARRHAPAAADPARYTPPQDPAYTAARSATAARVDPDGAPDWWRTAPGNDCDGGLDIAAAPPEFCAASGGWKVTCVCGGRMALFEVAAAACVHRCARPGCGFCRPREKYDGGRGAVCVYQCTACLCFHGAHQVERRIEGEVVARPQRGKPLGVPCSHATMCLRHRLHEEMLRAEAAHAWSKGAVYTRLAAVLEVPRCRAHVALLTAAQCRQAIEALAAL